MRINGRTWPYWAIGVVTVWFVAIAVFWAARPLVDHVPITVAHTPTAQEIANAQITGIAPPTRVPGPTVSIECGTPASSTARNPTAEQVKLGSLVDGKGVLFIQPQFVRVPCTEAHRQAHLLWYADTALYVLIVAGMGYVLVRRRRHQHLPEAAFATA